MADLFIRHLFAGGWASDFGPTTDTAPDANGFLRLPFLVDAEDVLYELDGAPHLAPGTTKLSTQLESGAVVKGLYDFWITGSTGTPVQHRVCHVGTKIKKDNANGTFTDLITGLTSGAIPSYAILDDLLLMCNGVDTPKSWDGTTAGNAAGSPPSKLGWAVRHQNRLFGGGDAANPSRLYYSVNLSGADWAGSGSGSIDIDPDDGDGLTGAASFKNQLILFKGPNKGAIHILTGSAPTGSDPFARSTFVQGVGAVGINSIFPYGDDLGWLWSDGSIRTLSVTNQYGDYRESALSSPIHKWISDHVNFSRLKHAHAVSWPQYGLVLLAIAIDGSTNNNAILAMDYRFAPVRWSFLRSFGAAGGALARVIDASQNSKLLVMGGGTDGYIRKFGAPSRSIDDASSLAGRVTTPYLTYGLPLMKKTIVAGALGIAPKNNGDLIFAWTRDNNAQQMDTVAQGGSDVLGAAAANQFTLDTSALGGSQFVDRFFPLDTGGEFRSIQFQILGGGLGEDFELHSLSAQVEPGASSLEN